MTRHPVGAYGRLFPQQHIPVILRLLLQVGKNIRKKTATDLEDWITTRLHRRLIHEPSFRDGPLQIHLHPGIVSSHADPEINTPEGQLDLQVSCGLGYEVYFAIEAKRLRVSFTQQVLFGRSGICKRWNDAVYYRPICTFYEGWRHAWLRLRRRNRKRPHGHRPAGSKEGERIKTKGTQKACAIPNIIRPAH